MNKAKKNVAIVGFENEEKNSISYPYIENSVVHYCNTISEAIKYQGYMIIINNQENINLVTLDKKYRKSLKKDVCFSVAGGLLSVGIGFLIAAVLFCVKFH